MSAGRRPPWLMLLALVVVMGAPVPWLVPAVAIGGVAIAAVRAIRAITPALRGARRPAGTLELGTDQRGRSVHIEPGELAAHGLILGASGTGKTTTLLRILTQQIQAGQAVIAIDMKGSPSFARTLAGACSAGGRSFQAFTMDGGASWNPLQYGNPTELKDKLIATERFTEPHYQRAAERYMQIALRVLQAAHPDRPPTLEEMVAVMDPRRLPVLLRELPSERAQPVRDYLAALSPDQHSAIRGVQSRLALITESQVGPSLSGAGAGGGPSIDLRRALGGEDVVLFSLNSSAYGNLAAQLGTLAVQDLVSALGRQLGDEVSPPPPATIAIDEFSGLGGDHVVALLARVREAGGAVLLATQEMADLERAASGLRDQVVGNTAFKLIHRQDVPASARMVAQMGGTERVWEETRPAGGGPFGGGRVGGGGRGIQRQVERYILDPNQIITLGTGEAAVISRLRGGRPRIMRVAPPSRPGPHASVRRPALPLAREAGRSDGRSR